MKTILLTLATACGLQAAEFAATGPVKETKLEPAQFLGAVKVTFDLLPTTMSFGLSWDIYAEFHASVCFPAKTRRRRSGIFSKSSV